jgi:hypothetical protein
MKYLYRLAELEERKPLADSPGCCPRAWSCGDRRSGGSRYWRDRPTLGPWRCRWFWYLRNPLERFVADSALEGTGFEPSVPRQEKWSMPSSSDQTRIGRTLTLGGGAESSLEGRDIESRSRRKTSVLCPTRIDDNLGRGTDGSNPLPSSAESRLDSPLEGSRIRTIGSA